ncbi:MAG: GNAT family N-acetyltransferase [Thiobacillus sp.]
MNKITFEVSRLSAADVEAVQSLARTVWQATYPALIPQAQIDAMLAERYAAPGIQKQLESPRDAWWIARQDGSVAAFAHAQAAPPDCKLDKLYVDPARQRSGIGAALLLAVSAWAQTQQATRLWLQVNRGNARAIRAYEKYGFRIVEARVFDIGRGFVMDDYILEKAL